MDIFDKLKGKRMLLIDDDVWIRDSLRLFFEAEGCVLFALETAEEGIEALNEQCYDIIISDYRLPGMDGLAFLKQVKKMQPRAVKILITAYGNKEVVSEARKIGIEDFIEKPFTNKSIEESLFRLIEKGEVKNEEPWVGVSK